jgi:uncharacterized membrane protein YphA (DoxX/SURF4 family)
MTTQARGKVGQFLLLMGRVGLAAVFLFAAYAKMRPQASMPWSIGSVKTSLAMFAMEVDSYQLLPPGAVSRVAQLLPPFELFLGLWLLSGVAVRISTLVTTLLLAGFFAVMVRSYALHLGINCGCFGPGEQLGPRTLIRDGSLLALSLAVTIGAFLGRRNHSETSAAADIASSSVTSQEVR